MEKVEGRKRRASSTSSEKSDNDSAIVKLAQNEYYFPVTSQRRQSASKSEISTDVTRVALKSGSHELTPINNFEGTESDGEDLEREEQRLTSFKDSELKSTDEGDDEWEESLLYIDLDDIPSVNELFAVEPDDFLTFQSRTQRELPKAPKKTVPELHLKIYNLESSSPILQIGTRYYVGKYEEPMGSALIFQKKVTATADDSNRLPSIVPDPVPPRDKVFHEKLRSSKLSEYELVANVSKILKMSRKEVRIAGGDTQKIPPTPGGLPIKTPTLPYGYNSASSLFTKPATEDESAVVSETLKKPGPVGPRSRTFPSSSSSDVIQDDGTDLMEVDNITIPQSPSCLHDQDDNSNNNPENTEEPLPEDTNYGFKI